jgi:hypothetical protein
MSKRSKTVLFFIGLGLLVFLLIVLFTKPASENINTKDNAEEQIEEIELIQTVPDEGVFETIFTSMGIKFEFNTILDLSSANVIIEPDIPIVVDRSATNSRILLIRPESGWEYNVDYKITIKSGLMSSRGSETKEDIQYKIRFKEATSLDNFWD